MAAVAVWLHPASPGNETDVPLWVAAAAGAGTWAVGLRRSRPDASWAGYYAAWMALTSLVVRAHQPHEPSPWSGLYTVGAVMAAVEKPTLPAFLTLGAWGLLTNLYVHASSGVAGLASPDLWVVNGLIGVAFGAAVSGVRRLQALHQESLTDPLTGIANRRAFFRALSSACRDAGVEGPPFSLLLLDLDRFKSVNDTLGHDVGDRLLRGFARTAAHMLRPYGTLYRYGGDEFVAILPGLTVNEASALAERLRQKLATLPARLPGDGGLTVSVGVAAYPDHGRTPEELIRSADMALLYGAKLGGRNRVATPAPGSPPGSADMLCEDVPEEAVALLKVLGAVTGETVDHVLRVAALACQLGQRLRLTEEELRVLRLGAIFHDIGKLVIPRALLDKAGPLAESEGEQVSHHAELGAVLVANLGLDPRVADVVRHHHERWDGKGYPDGLRGEDIPLLARILAVADAYDAMTAPRPYHSPCSPSEALEELQRGAGHQFDPLVVSAMAQLAAPLTAASIAPAVHARG